MLGINKIIRKWRENKRKANAYRNNILDVDQTYIIDKQVAEMKGYFKDNASEGYKEEREKVKKHNNICPNCYNSDQKQIVDKIAQVQGKGEVKGNVYGSFMLGFGSIEGSISGSSKTDTSPVNHCNKCGNQWKKTKEKYIGSKELIVKAVGNIFNYVESQYSWSKKDFDAFGKYYAEAIYELTQFVNLYFPSYLEDKITLKFFRKHFKSIHNINTEENE